ncbi:hypothetical protein [Lelliottia sp. CFBP8978]|jgi:hypothetical protein|uniref:hypothetical protein n=1 Tax=Lelliottia sp. CFBP8978 TaxID=3096522 RepID=UPI002A6B39A5|nr:hypothetical protein [Lelliottia sp. CFBP8978]
MRKENKDDFAITIIQSVNSNYIVIWSLGFMWWFGTVRVYFNTDHGISAPAPARYL